MSEIPKSQPNEDLEALTQAEITRSTQPLIAAMERGGLGAEGNRQLGERVLDITQLVQDSPERVQADATRQPHRRTEYDKERAHTVARVIDPEMTFIAKDKRKNGDGRWSTKRQRAELSARRIESIAQEIYDNNPVDNGPKVVEGLIGTDPKSRRRRGFKQFA